MTALEVEADGRLLPCSRVAGSREVEPIFVGHYSAAFIAKALTPRVPLWAFVLAAQLVDLAWASLVLAGIEHLRIDPDLPSNPLVLDFNPYTHSLSANLVWVLATFFVARAWLRETRAALAVALVAGSHWFLDLLVHRPDLALWGNACKVGLALWDHPVAALLLELALFTAACFVLLRSSSLPLARRRAYFWFAIGLLLAQLVSFFGAVPASPTAFVLGALLLWLVFTGWAYRVEPDAVGVAA